ncbi:hypothetical protein C8R45DRAFT_877402 [Mycena sanguinolenta]|nr:hypothetical protein C8R45DRAFT_877402 [Mycena sanguinolenta]
MDFETDFTDGDLNRPQHAVPSAPLRISGALTLMLSEPHPRVARLTPAAMSSPFASRLGTNYSPTDEEVLEIRSILVEPTLRIKKLDDEIADLQRSIDKLAEERVGLESYVEAHSALISPVRRLPLDIIQVIFAACMPTHRNCVMSATEAPILLGRICSAWRTISLASPRLWASLHVVEPLPSSLSNLYEHKVEQRLEAAKMWIGRSSQCPLSISLLGAPDDPGDGLVEGTVTKQFIQALIPFAPRWQHIHFAIPYTLILEVMSNIDTDMPWLESVTLRSERMPHPNSTTTCGSFEMLAGARISSFSVPGGLCALGLPLQWTQLTTLTIDGPEPPGCTSQILLPVISRCSQLRSCKLLLRDDGLEMLAREHPIVELGFLHSLAIRCSSSVIPAISILLKHLSLPELRNFVLLSSLREDLDCSALADFFARSIHLDNFEFGDTIFSMPSFHEALRTLPPAIQQLRLRRVLNGGWGELDDESLRILATPGLCPALRHLTIDRSSNISNAAVLQFITARMLQFIPRTLEHVDIKFDQEMTDDIMPSLQPFLETGLAVSLDYPQLWTLPSSPWEGLEDGPDDPFWSRRPINYW